jgi:K+-sensing histidine kinase KdpD
MRPPAITFSYPLAWPAPRRYGAAAVLVLLAVGLRWMIAPTEHGLAFVTVYPAVLVACFALGLGPGALVATVGGLAGTFFFLAPHYTFAKPPATYLNVLFYALTCTLVSLIVNALHRSASHLRHALAEIQVRRDQLERQVEERTTELKTAKEGAESATLAKAAFLANVTREIRSVERDRGPGPHHEALWCLARTGTAPRQDRDLGQAPARDRQLGTRLFEDRSGSFSAR